MLNVQLILYFAFYKILRRSEYHQKFSLKYLSMFTTQTIYFFYSCSIIYNFQLDFLSENEEADLMKGIDEMPWELSQSGRRKQVYFFAILIEC